MNMNEETEKITEQKEPEVSKKPDDTGGFYFSSFVKITDPNSQEILVQVRGDN